jgi:hypothetical protein
VAEAARGLELNELGGLLLNDPDDVETDMMFIVAPPPPPVAAIVIAPELFVMEIPEPAVKLAT